MALDGIFLHKLAQEITRQALGARVDKIHQPAREELVITLRSKGGPLRLLLSASANAPRIHFTDTPADNPKEAPMLCMLLRKHLGGARLAAVEQQGLDRVLFLVFEARTELGEETAITLAVEIMGRHSNIIAYDEEGRIIAPIKRVGPEESAVRPVLAGMDYSLPPAQDKLSILEAGAKAVADAALASGRDAPLSKLLLEHMQGASPLLCREISHRAAPGADPVASALTPEHRERLLSYLSELESMLRDGEPSPTAIISDAGKIIDFSCVDIAQYGPNVKTRAFGSLSELLDFCYVRSAADERNKQRAGELLRRLTNLSERASRKAAAQRQELLECENREELRIAADLISANLHLLKKGQASAELENFYEPEGRLIKIALDTALTPAQNAQAYYKRYRKAKSAAGRLTGLIEQSEEQRAYIDSVLDLLSRAATQDEIEAIRQELEASGVLGRGRARRDKRAVKLEPVKYISSDGFTILAGRSNTQNDQLTLKTASKQDMWLHTQKIHGSHVIIVSGGREIPRATLEQAARIAALHSRARDSSGVPVDYTQVKNVRKPAGAKPGMVIYDNYRTLYVTPDAGEAGSLLAR